jgi:hypothetical protein
VHLGWSRTAMFSAQSNRAFDEVRAMKLAAPSSPERVRGGGGV